MFSFHGQTIVPARMAKPATTSNITTFTMDCTKRLFESQAFSLWAMAEYASNLSTVVSGVISHPADTIPLPLVAA